jgi:hypothetical protein
VVGHNDGGGLIHVIIEPGHNPTLFRWSARNVNYGNVGVTATVDRECYAS